MIEGGSEGAMTNYEKIKAMPLEEVAKWIDLLGLGEEADYCKANCKWVDSYDMPEGECLKCAEKWLREEAK